MRAFDSQYIPFSGEKTLISLCYWRQTDFASVRIKPPTFSSNSTTSVNYNAGGKPVQPQSASQRTGDTPNGLLQR
jgi:hypothetical protein